LHDCTRRLLVAEGGSMNRLIDGVWIFVAATAVLVVSAEPATAQTGKTTIGFTAGSGIPLTENLKDYTHADLALQGHATVGLVGALAIRGEVGQTRFKVVDTIDLFCPDCRLDVDHMSVGVQYGGFGDEGALGLSNASVLPYGFVAIGWYGLGSQLADDLDFPSERRVGFNAGFGINIRVTEHFGFQGDVHLHGVSFDEGLDTDYWIAPQGGIWVSF
jgi:hypothetical protein